VLAHVAGVPVEELLLVALAGGAAAAGAVAHRLGRVLRRRPRA
jgi:hypothetical protein